MYDSAIFTWLYDFDYTVMISITQLWSCDICFIIWLRLYCYDFDNTIMILRYLLIVWLRLCCCEFDNTIMIPWYCWLYDFDYAAMNLITMKWLRLCCCDFDNYEMTSAYMNNNVITNIWIYILITYGIGGKILQTSKLYMRVIFKSPGT